jgi:hypothetical protein
MVKMRHLFAEVRNSRSTPARAEFERIRRRNARVPMLVVRKHLEEHRERGPRVRMAVFFTPSGAGAAQLSLLF